ncbi:FAD binding domain protein [Purpureocillium lavendulum]|uniref:FAD binding domain protein n=1 Tax=Purpureocillium lavendulum TaxID=1247861 RepID=A0AB34G1S6_9HYPO|nr:FAD binding domain protein [Purpureocillium lavendulum]
MTTHTLYLVTYDRGKYPITQKVKPYHWAYFIELTVAAYENSGIAHQLRGMPGSFGYKGPEPVDLAKSGRMEASKMDQVHKILKTVRIDTVESSGWNCQDWALEGFDALRAEGFVYDHMEADAVKTWLREE